MADFTDVVDPVLTFEALGAPLTPEQHALTDLKITDAANIPVPSFFQRIYDSGNNVYVYYTLSQVSTTPAIGDTTPNHSGTLDAATHEVIKEN